MKKARGEMFRWNGFLHMLKYTANFVGYFVLHFYKNNGLTGLKTFMLCAKYINLFINTCWLYLLYFMEIINNIQ